jgi:hypothetical protein
MKKKLHSRLGSPPSAHRIGKPPLQETVLAVPCPQRQPPETEPELPKGYVHIQSAIEALLQIEVDWRK